MSKHNCPLPIPIDVDVTDEHHSYIAIVECAKCGKWWAFKSGDEGWTNIPHPDD